MDYWSGAQPHEASQLEVSSTSTMFASQVIVASYSTLFYLVLLILSILGVFYEPCAKIFTSQATSMLFLIGTLMVFVNIFTTEGELEIKSYFRIATGFLIGIAFTIFGAYLFFKRADDNNNQCALERQQPSMGLVVAMITIPLIILELFLIASTFGSKELEGPEKLFQTRYDWVLVLVDKLTFLIQKIVQAVVYIILRFKITSEHYRESARFYFQILSFFNLIEWVDSQVNEDKDVQLSGSEEIYGPWFDVFAMLYKALIIDYRLLCSLLFLEHSLEDNPDGQTEGNNATTRRDLTLSERRLKRLGFMVGFTSLSAPICCALFNVPRLEIPPWVHVFTMLVNLAIIGFGILFLRINDFTSEERNTGSSGVKIMVSCLGAAGFVCWMLKATIAAYWACTTNNSVNTSSNFSWVSAKLCVRGIATAFLMGLFLKVDARTVPMGNLGLEMNHFLVPTIMLTIFGTFLETLIDQYAGPLDNRLSKEIKELSLNVLFDAGPPLYLGFLIHVFLHFVIIQTKIAQQPRARRTTRIPNYGAVNDPVLNVSFL